jgi:hypothetical protein
VDRDDARVVEPGEGAGLRQIGCDILGAGDALRVGDLDRHGAIELVVASQVDPAESPPRPRSRTTRYRPIVGGKPPAKTSARADEEPA